MPGYYIYKELIWYCWDSADFNNNSTHPPTIHTHTTTHVKTQIQFILIFEMSSIATPDTPSPPPSFAERMMKDMGWTVDSGRGLGPDGKGRLDPIAPHRKIPLAGLGYEYRGAELTFQGHEYVEESVTIDIHVDWRSYDADAATTDKKIIIAAEEEDGGKEEEIVVRERLNAIKSTLDNIDARVFGSARLRSNPFELLKREQFQNRAALKMAELDRLCGHIFSVPPSLLLASRQRRRLMRFGDICAGPGGFSEYLLTRLKWRAQGFGFTLKSGWDFATHRFNREAPTNSFKAYYGEDGTGDITRSENIRDFTERVREETEGQWLDVVMADGGFSVDGRENQQEALSAQLICCQFCMAMSTLCRGGVFVCKLFNTFLPITRLLIDLLVRNFESYAIVKPNQSRPANSERYIVCRGFKRRRSTATAADIDYLYRLNDDWFKNNNNDDDTISSPTPPPPPPPPLRSLALDSYIRKSNTEMANRQCNAIIKLRKYIEDSSLASDNQTAIRHQCLDHWKLPLLNRQFGRYLSHTTLGDSLRRHIYDSITADSDDFWVWWDSRRKVELFSYHHHDDAIKSLQKTLQTYYTRIKMPHDVVIKCRRLLHQKTTTMMIRVMDVACLPTDEGRIHSRPIEERQCLVRMFFKSIRQLKDGGGGGGDDEVGGNNIFLLVK